MSGYKANVELFRKSKTGIRKKQSKKMKIYISGQITGLSEKEYKDNFNKSDYDLFIKYTKQGAYPKIINPLNIAPLFGVKKWTFFMLSDLIELRKCTHIAMQKNWINSKGAVIEYFFAKFIFKLEIIFL